jgi:hypothetical protein
VRFFHAWPFVRKNNDAIIKTYFPYSELQQPLLPPPPPTKPSKHEPHDFERFLVLIETLFDPIHRVHQHFSRRRGGDPHFVEILGLVQPFFCLPNTLQCFLIAGSAKAHHKQRKQQIAGCQQAKKLLRGEAEKQTKRQAPHHKTRWRHLAFPMTL